MFYFDPFYLLVMLISLVLSLWATAKVKGAFAKYRNIPSRNGLTGQEVAHRILTAAGVSANVSTVHQRTFLGGDGGDLIDFYDPRDRTVRLSPGIFNGSSIAAQAIAAHEVGHAIQHARGYAALRLRNAIAPAAAFGSNVAYFFILIGFLMHTLSMLKLGILFFAIAVFFQLITVPVEFDASRRGKQMLQQLGMVSDQENKGVAAVLDAAALTYVAAAATALLNLVYLLLRARER